MAGQIYDSSTLDSVMRVQKKPTLFFLDRFFNRQINFQTQDIVFDMVYGDDRRLAPFVVPNVQGRVLGVDGYETRVFKPAYMKPKHVVDPNMVIERQPGEALGTGSLTLEQRRNAVIAELLRQHKVRLNNSWEWLAAKAIIDGKVTIQGEDYPAVTVDFRRHSSLTYTLTGPATWDQASTADPLANLKAARINANQRSGARIQTHIFGGDAWDLFAARVNLKDLMDTRYGGSETRVTLMADGYEGVEYMGRIQGLNGAGAIDAWVHTGKYVDLDGTEKFFLDQKTVVGVSESVQGVRCFGAIKDADAGYVAQEIFSKNWRNQDPSVEYLLSQSAPLMVPKQPDATFAIKVAA